MTTLGVNEFKKTCPSFDVRIALLFLNEITPNFQIHVRQNKFYGTSFVATLYNYSNHELCCEHDWDFESERIPLY
jgi:hypothetical protein